MGQTRSMQEIQAALQESKAKAVLGMADSQKWPKISAIGQYSTSDDISTQLPDDNQALLKAEQNILPFLSSDWMKAGQREAEYQASQTEHTAARQDVDLLVKQLYFAVLRDQDAVSQVARVRGDFQTLLDYLTPQFSVGRVPRFDAVKVKASLADLDRNRALTLAQLAGEKSELAQVLGLKPDADLDLKLVSALPDLPANAVDKNLEGNPTLLALTQRADAARIGLDADSFARLPSLDASFRYGYTAPTWESLSQSWDVTVQLNLPLLDWGLISSQADQDRADWQLAQNALENQRQQLVSQLEQAQATAQAYRDDQKRLEALLPQTEQASHAAVKQYRVGAMGIVETTDAVDLWLTTSLNERNAYYSYLTNLAQLERLTGGKWTVKYE
jgi:outer membrane protein